MKAARMFGVVLWSSDNDDRAVVWCEDHGSLAYFTDQSEKIHADINLDAGDLIEFDLADDTDHRCVHNPRRLVEDAAPELASNLSRAKPRRDVSESREFDNVIRFPGRAPADNQLMRV